MNPTDLAASKQAIERIKRATSIEAVVRVRVPELKRKGKLHWACCPFHEEKTSSFCVDPVRQTWRCFGACAEGGDSISFVQRFDGLSFWDALTLLSNECGEPLPARSGRERRPEEEEHRDRLFEVLARAQAHYARAFEDEAGEAARQYLQGRGLSIETARAFGCGWSAAHGSPLLDVATRAGIPLDLLVESGLVKLADDGRPFDFFRNRLLIPIRDRLGRTVGFGGRILPKDAARAPKYVNTPETPLFHKGRLIYALDMASDMVRKRRHLVLVEGYTDVMAAHQVDVANVAAVLGTATTADHAALVRRSGAERVTLVFDGDAAGGKASQKALGELLPLGLKLDVVAPPAGQDPCDVLVGSGLPEDSTEGGAAAFEALLDSALDWFSWCLAGLSGLEGAALANAVENLFELIQRLERPVEEALRRKELAATLGIPAHTVEDQWNRWRQELPAVRRADRQGTPNRAVASENKREPEQVPTDPRVREAFRSIIGAMLSDNSLVPLHGHLIERAPEGPERRIFEALLHLYEHGDETEPIDAGSVTTALGEDSARDLVVGLELAASRASSAQALVEDQERWLERHDREQEVRAMLRSLSDAEQRPQNQSLNRSLARSLNQQNHPDVAHGDSPEGTPAVPGDYSRLQSPGGGIPTVTIPSLENSDSQSSDELLRILHAELKKGRVPRASPGSGPRPGADSPQSGPPQSAPQAGIPSDGPSDGPPDGPPAADSSAESPPTDPSSGSLTGT